MSSLAFLVTELQVSKLCTRNHSATDRTHFSPWLANRGENIRKYARWMQCSIMLSLAHLTAIVSGSREIAGNSSVFS